MVNIRCLCFLLLICIVHIQGQCSPQQLQITRPSSRELTVTWMCNDGGTLQESNFEYQVNYQLTNIGQCQPVTEVPVGNEFSRRVPVSLVSGPVYEYSVTLTNLRPYSSYSISVTTRRIGASTTRTGAPLTTTTDQEVPSAAPANIRTTNPQRTQLTFTWDEVPCGSRHGSITEYVWRLDSDASTGTDQILTGRVVRRYTFYGLSPGTRYTFNVAARNSIGNGTRGIIMATTISDTLAIYCTSNIALTAPGESGALVSYINPTVSGGVAPYNSACIPQSGSLFSIARHTLTCTVTDAASTEEACTFTVFVNAPLWLICPPSITVTAVSGQSDARVIYSHPTVTGGTNPLDVLCNPLSGSLFNIGTHTVTCTVMDSALFMAQCTFQLEVIPDIQIEPPANINADDILTTSIRFSWSEATCSGSCPDGITGYSHRLMPGSNGAVLNSRHTGGNQRTVTITELMPCTEYAFIVAGMSGSVTGAYSSEARVTTDGQAPGEITGLSLTAQQTNSFRAEWGPPAGPCLAETYTIEYRLTNKDQCVQTPDSSRMVGTTEAMPGGTTIAGLLPYSTYEVFVRAVNSNGDGPETNVEVTTLSQVPTAAPSDVEVTSTDLVSLSFSWGEVHCGSRHGDITQYNYQLSDESGNVVAGDDSATSNRQITINGVLMPCSTYKFQVRAIWNGIIGPYSDSITAITSTSVANLNAEPISSTELKVSWEAPTALCTADVVYEVEYRLTNRGQCEPKDENAFMTEPVSGTTVTLSDLHPYSTYEIQVRASGGVAPMSNRTYEAAPSGPPSAVNVTSTTNTTIEITWDKPVCTERNGNITGYTYSLLETESSTSTFKDIDTTYTTVIFMDLTPSTPYRFSISANTNSGKGPLHFVDLTTKSAELDESTKSNIGAAVGGSLSAIVIVVIIIGVVFIVYFRRRQAADHNTNVPTANESRENEAYDEIDQQSKSALPSHKLPPNDAKTKITGYEVNITMTGMRSTGQVLCDGEDYEDVNIKTESDYQGLNVDDIEKENEYQGMSYAGQVSCDGADYEDVNNKSQSHYQGLNVGNMEEEHKYQGLGKTINPSRKSSSPYVNVA